MSRELGLSEIAEKLAVEFCGDVSITTVIHVVGECARNDTFTSLTAVEQAARARLTDEASSRASQG